MTTCAKKSKILTRYRKKFYFKKPTKKLQISTKYRKEMANFIEKLHILSKDGERMQILSTGHEKERKTWCQEWIFSPFWAAYDGIIYYLKKNMT